jgi:hypothetical protein
MNEISHQQAQRFLRSRLDLQLPNEQWMVLHDHLETCASCRAYDKNLSALEKSIRRSLRAGWEDMHDPSEETSGDVIFAFQRRRARRRWKILAAVAAAVLALIILLAGGPSGIRARFSATNASQFISTGTPQAGLSEPPAATLQPTVEPGQFPDVIAYESRRDGFPNGDREIFLLNPGSAPVNLTNHPAQDTDPAWSPDGEWLAFLSDRAGKVEVFLTDIAGGRVTQLTDEPGITWQAPLSWSPDGLWIILGGARDRQGSQNWIYLVALDGTGVRALAGSRGGDSPKFSPSGSHIAFHYSDGQYEGIIVQNRRTGGQAITRWVDNALVPSLAPGSAFDFSPDGSELAYISASPNPVAAAGQPSSDAPLLSGMPGSQVSIITDIDNAASQPARRDSITVGSSRWPWAFRGVTWSPGGYVAYLEDLGDARANDKPGTQPEGCWSIQIRYPGTPGQDNPDTGHPTSFGGLCVEGGLGQASWTGDGSWIVVQGRLPSEDRISIYGLRMPTKPGQGGATHPADPGTILRLSDDPWPGSLPSPRPRPGSNTSGAGVDPHPVKNRGSSMPPSNMINSRSFRDNHPAGWIHVSTARD